MSVATMEQDMAKARREEEPEMPEQAEKPKTTHVRMKMDLYEMLRDSAKAEGTDPGVLLDKIARPQIKARWIRNKPIIDQQKRMAREEEAGQEEEDPKPKRRRSRGQE